VKLIRADDHFQKIAWARSEDSGERDKLAMISLVEKALDPRTRPNYGFNGFFGLHDADALLRKMRYDYNRIVAEPMNAYPGVCDRW